MRLDFFSTAFAVVSVTLLVTLGAALGFVASSFDEVSRALEQRTATVALTTELSRLLQTDGEGRPDKVRSIALRMKEAGAAEAELKILDKVIDTSGMQQKLQQAASAAMQGSYDAARGELVTSGTEFVRKTLYGPEYDKLQADLTTDVNRLADLASARASTSVQTAIDHLWRMILMLCAGMVVLLLLTLAAALYINRSILRPIRRIAAGAHRLAEGNYTTRVQAGKAVAELGTVAGAFNKLATAVEEDIRNRIHMSLELQKARAAAESAARAIRLDLELRPFDLQQVIADSLSLVRQGGLEKAVELQLEIDPQLLRAPHFVGDGLRLAQILINLLSNAVKFTERGYVRLSASILEEDEDAMVLFFTVTDTGMGMTKEQVTQLFAETPADAAIARAYDGMGGLAVAKRLVEMMGGDIDVESEPGGGSCFHFTVRLAKGTSAAPQSRAADRTLLVDEFPEGRTEIVIEEHPSQQKERDNVVDISVPRVNGLDSVAGLKRTRGNQELYLSLLGQFVTAFAAFGEELTLLLREGKHAEGERLAHALKNDAAAVGASRVADAAAQLEHALREAEAPDKALAAVERELRPLVQALADQLNIDAMMIAMHPAMRGPG